MTGPSSWALKEGEALHLRSDRSRRRAWTPDRHDHTHQGTELESGAGAGATDRLCVADCDEGPAVHQHRRDEAGHPAVRAPNVRPSGYFGESPRDSSTRRGPWGAAEAHTAGCGAPQGAVRVGVGGEPGRKARGFTAEA